MLKSIFFNRIAKIIVDILLIAGLFLSMSSGHSEGSALWGSFHCIVSMTWYALMLAHIAQHWRLTKALVKPKVMKRNKITFLSLIVFIALTFSIILFVADVGDKFVRMHHGVASLFSKVMIIHLIMMAKRLVKMFNFKEFLPTD